MKPHRPLAALAIAALLTACGSDTPEEGEASGEVLEGTISDEMLRLEQVRSRVPLAEPTSMAAGGPASAVDEASEPEDDEAAGRAEPLSGEPGDEAE